MAQHADTCAGTLQPQHPSTSKGNEKMHASMHGHSVIWSDMLLEEDSSGQSPHRSWRRRVAGGAAMLGALSWWRVLPAVEGAVAPAVASTVAAPRAVAA